MLGSQLAELQQKLDRSVPRGRLLQMMLTLESSSRMEAEMTIVSEESRELADTLEEREVELLLKVRTFSGTKTTSFSKETVNSFYRIDFSLG